MDRILVPVDGSESANRAAAFAARLANDADATVELVYVYDAPMVAQIGLEAVSGEKLEEIKRGVSRGSIDAARKAIADALGADTVELVEHTTFGHPAQEIVGRAKAGGHDMIVMGTRGQSAVKELLLGSVSQFVLHHAPCPTTIVR